MNFICIIFIQETACIIIVVVVVFIVIISGICRAQIWNTPILPDLEYR